MTTGASDPRAAQPLDFTAEVVARLSARTRPASRYRIEGEIATGGMGAVLRVWDEDLRRTLAMKVALGQGEVGSPDADTATTNARALARFLEEAQVTGQLDHPGIVPVHELGLDERGRVFFTMRLVAGRTLKEIFELVREGREGWNQTRALGVLLKVCETMAYAHSKEVLHRDLKPANVMVGRFGEVYVMDWGLARVLDRPGAVDERSAARPDPLNPWVQTDRREARGSSPDSALPTLDGDVLGTPAYMSPEQARGALDAVGRASDVYSAGAILYELLAGHPPHVPPGSPRDTVSVWTRVHRGPPEPLGARAPQAAAELVAICERAMARESADRYPQMLDFAEDLRAYLEGRVVRAYRTGAVAELRKWVGRNKALATTSAATILLVSLGSLITAWVLARKNQQLARITTQAQASEVEARRNAAIADERAAQVLRLSDITQVRDLVSEAERLWPAHPELVPAYERWLSRAADLDQRRSIHVQTLERIRLGASAAVPGAWTFATAEDQWQHEALQELVERLDRLRAPTQGLVAQMRTRLEFARTVHERSIDGEEARELWSTAVADIADPARSPHYRGLRVAPQLGLLPLGRDPSSGLWEFAHLQTGAPAVRDEVSGMLALDDASGVVLVLLPGGAFSMGAQSDDPGAPNFDPAAELLQGPVHEVELAPFFISKYEMTQSQWLRFTGANPSVYPPGTSIDGVATDGVHPVEQVSWTQASEVLTRLALVLPTEAQWEYAARAGTQTPWSTGADKTSLEGYANLVDRAAARAGANWPGIDDWPELDDGHAVHARVDAYQPNGFGLFGVHGNVWEWCRDLYGPYDSPVREGDGEHEVVGNGNRVNRGGGFRQSAHFARSSHRNNSAPDFGINHLGLRPARALDL